MNPSLYLTRAQVRNVDRIAIERYGISGLVLMENAGRSVAEWIARNLPPGDVCILCGKGNNGGDGYVIARHLELEFDRMASFLGDAMPATMVRVVSVVEPEALSGDAAINHRVARLSQIPILIVTDTASLRAAIGQPDLLIDCLLGTGASGDPLGIFADAIGLANDLPTRRVAVDVPSGLDCDSGVAGEPTFRAEATLTLVASKVGFRQAAAEPWLGQVVVLPIGIPRFLLRSLTLDPA
jgi:NAD(P)H-hydrate epimerase